MDRLSSSSRRLLAVPAATGHRHEPGSCVHARRTGSPSCCWPSPCSPGALAPARHLGGAVARWLLTAAVLTLAGAGGLGCCRRGGLAVAALAAGSCFVLFLVLVFTGRWLRPLACDRSGRVAVLGLGGLATLAAGEAWSPDALRLLCSLESASPGGCCCCCWCR